MSVLQLVHSNYSLMSFTFQSSQSFKESSPLRSARALHGTLESWEVLVGLLGKFVVCFVSLLKNISTVSWGGK